MKTFLEGAPVEVIRDTEYGRPWEGAKYLTALPDFRGWHRVVLDATAERIIVPARRIRSKEKS